MESLASVKKNLLQSRTSVLSVGTMSKGATCEELEKITIDDDVEKFFLVGA